MSTPHTFTAALFATSMVKGAWYFVEVPAECAPEVTGSWGMTPVKASADGVAWETTVWREKSGRCLLPVPKKIRKQKQAGDTMVFTLKMDGTRAMVGRQTRH